MGEKQDQPFQLSFNASMKPDSQEPRVTPDGGRFLVRKLDKHFGTNCAHRRARQRKP
jgi:hypothetical protein